MSYILDALNKADRERQLGHVPTLSTQHSTNTDRNRYLLVWLLPVVIIVVVFSTLIWPLVDDFNVSSIVASFKENSSVDSAETTQHPSTDSSKKNTTENTPSSDNIDAAISRSAVNGTISTAAGKPKSHFTTPNLNQHQSTEPSRETTSVNFPPTLKNDLASMENSNINNNIHYPDKKMQPNPNLSFAQVAGITHKNRYVNDSPATLSNNVRTPILKPQQQVHYNAIPDDSLIENLEYTDSPLLLTQKAIEFQQAVPSVDIDVHVFSDDPSKRFVLINMVKYQEGQFVKDGLYLREITSAGIVFTFQNDAFLVLANQNIN